MQSQPATAELTSPSPTASVPTALTLCGPGVPPPEPPPSQPWLRGAAALALIRSAPDPALPPRRRRAPWLFHRPRRETLEQMLMRQGCIFPFAYGPPPRTPYLRKLPVIGRSAAMSSEGRRALDKVSDNLSATDLAELFAENPRPRTRGDCADAPRPCPWVSCRHHLMLDVHPSSGSIRLNHPDLDLEQMRETCALDVAEQTNDTGRIAPLESVAALLGISHERIRQIETEAKGAFAFKPRRPVTTEAKPKTRTRRRRRK
jgi:hypothetical protein